jgi:hypothetical protein
MDTNKLLASLLLFPLYFSCKAEEKKIIINNCNLVENGIEISIDLINFKLYHISNVEIIETDDLGAILIETDDIAIETNDNRIKLHLNLNEKRLFMNKSYKLLIRFPGGYTVADMFIGNPISKINEYYDFPIIPIPNVKIIIIDQGYLIGR